MSRLLPLLLLSLTLLTAACKKDTAAPAPTLEGRWIEHSHLDYTYDKSGKFLKELSYTPPTPTYGMIIHPTAFEWIGVKPDGTWVSSFSDHIRRQEDILHFLRKPGDEFDLRIVELTESRLTLRREHVNEDPNTGEYHTWNETFSR